jgi:hypothetical protein
VCVCVCVYASFLHAHAHIFFGFVFPTCAMLMIATPHLCDQVSPDELAVVLLHAEQVRQSNLPDLADVGLQAWRGDAADDGALDRSREEQACALADFAFAQGAGAFWDGDGDDEGEDGVGAPMDAV